MRFITVLLLFYLSYIISAENLKYSYETKYIDLPVDHFSFTSNLTFKLRYLINDSYHNDRGPIFFYTGNEGDITSFAQNTGFMFDIAPNFNALIVFAEHRYYGTSLPFGNLSFTSPTYLGYLTSGQALADYVYLINELQNDHVVSKDLRRLPVIAFGGSYGGMLSAWLRMKYPSSVVGAIASSAPIWQFKGLTPCENFDRIVTDVYEGLGGYMCKKTIQNSWAVIRSETQNDTGKLNLTQMWNLCSPLKTGDDINKLVDWLTDIYTNLAMVNYPYPTDFLVPLPGSPVREFCNKIVANTYNNNIGLLKTLGIALEVYTNYTKTKQCNDIGQTADNIGELGWDFQACTEMIMPMCSTSSDMFENYRWDFKKYSDECYKKFGVRPWSEEVPILEYGGRDIKDASNIVFSNGLLDPWSSGGVLSNITTKILAVVIPDGAHHFDLRGKNKYDTGSVRSARIFHVVQIKKWLNKFYLENVNSPAKIFAINDNSL